MRSVNRTSQRLAAIAPSATLAVDSKAKAMKAAGENVVGFGAGEPDFPTPAHIVEAAVEACRDPKNHRYSPAGGLPELKTAIAAKTARDSGYEVDASQILVTNGGKHAVYTAFAALCDPGDEVLLPAPYWTTYPEAITLAGGVPVVIDTSDETGFKVTTDQLDAARTDRTKVLLFVSPDNPSGSVYTAAEVKAIGEWAVANGVWVVTDEIYEHLTYGAHEFASMPTLVPDLAEQCLVVNGVAKTYAMTGWRVGWMIGPNDVVKASSNFQSHATSNVSNVAQRAAIAAVSGPLDDVVMMREEHASHAQRDRRRDMSGAAGGVLLLPQRVRPART
jgi:aspartate/methionine/tyrosine aminotransferase